VANKARAKIHGFLVPDPRIGDALGATTEAGAEPGQPGGDSALVVRSHGLTPPDMLSAAGSVNKSIWDGWPLSGVDVKVTDPGFPGRTPRHAGFKWRQHRLGVAQDWLGHNGVTLYDNQAIYPTSGSNDRLYPCLIACKHQSQYGVHVAAYQSAGGIYAQIEETAADENYQVAANWNTIGSVTIDASVYSNSAPALLELPDGTILCYYWIAPVAGTKQIRCKRSQDAGLTWDTYSNAVLPQRITCANADTRQIRVAYSAGEICLMVGWNDGTDELVSQYASSGDGAGFALIAEYRTSSTRYFQQPDVVALPAGFLITWWAHTDIMGVSWRNLQYARVGSAFQSGFANSRDLQALWNTTVTPINPILDGNQIIWRDDDGAIYWLIPSQNNTGTAFDVKGVVSFDDGETWQGSASETADLSLTNGYRHFDFGEGSTTYTQLCSIRGGQAAQHEGRVTIVATWYDSGVPTYAALTAYRLGAYATHTPRATDRLNALSYEPPTRVFFPNTGGTSWTLGGYWTVTTAGAGSAATASDRVRLTGAGAGDSYYATCSVNASSGFARFDFVADMISGGGVGATDVFFRLSLSNGVDSEYDVIVRFSTTQVRVFDFIAGTTLGTYNVTTTTEQRYRLELNQNGKVWFANAGYNGPTDGLPRAPRGGNQIYWSGLHSGTATKLAVGVSATGFASFGVVTGTGVIDVYSAVITQADETYSLPPTQDDLLGRRFSASPVYLMDGLGVSAIDGPAQKDDSWNVPYRFRYGIDKVDPREFPSPRAQWRSTNTDLLDHELQWDFNDSDENGGVDSQLWGMYLGAVNFRTATLDFWDPGTASWVTALSVDTASGFSGLRFLRLGDRLVPNHATSGQAARYIYANELKGYTADIDGDLRTIRSNTAGWWSTAANGPQASILLQGVDGTEAANDGDKVALNIWHRQFLGIVANSSLMNRGSKFRLTIPIQDTKDGYFAIGNLVIGKLVTFDDTESRSVETVPTVEVSERRDGTRVARRLAPPRRRVSLVVGQRTNYQIAHKRGTTTADLDYLGVNSATTPSTGAADLPETFAGLIRSQDGALVPCVYCPSVDNLGTTAQVSIVDRQLAIYGRITSTAQLDYMGDEDEVTETVRATSIVFEEEI